MKKTVLSMAMMLAMTAGAHAGGGDTVTIPAEDYKAILERLNALQKRVESLESGNKAPTNAKYDKLARDIDNIYDTMDELETKQIKNKLNFGAELRTRVDGYKAKDYTRVNMTTFQNGLGTGLTPQQALAGAIEQVDKTTDSNNWTNRFRINMDAKITDGLSFHGRLAMFKNWADSDDGTDSGLFNDSNRVQRPNSSNLWVDRAYVDWIPQGLPFPLAITVGRHPSTEGPPFEFKENRLRQSTYPSLIFDGEADGIVATIGLDRYTGLKENGLRFAFGKAYHSDDDNNTGSPFPFFDDDEAGDSTIFATFFETQVPGLKDSLLVLSYAHVWDLPFYLTGPELADTGIANTDLGDLDLWGVHFQAKNIRGTGLDFFTSYAGNSSDPSGKAPMGLYGLLSWDGQESHTGYSLYTGFRYTLPSDWLRGAKFGFEYNYGSQYWFSMTMGTPDLFNKLATRGSVYDFYYIQPVNKYLFFRTGYMRVNYDYTGSGQHMGQPMPTDASLDNYYLLMDVHF
ncbi:putative porin [Desulfolithobacter sp.]